MPSLVLEKLKSELRVDEGIVLKEYVCPAGYRSIGIGFNRDAHDYPEKVIKYLEIHGYPDNEIPIEVAEYLLDVHARLALKEAREIFPEFHQYSVRRRAAIANMIYNMGKGTFLQFKNTIQNIKNHHWEYAAQGIEGSLYYRQVGKRGKRVASAIRNG